VETGRFKDHTPPSVENGEGIGDSGHSPELNRETVQSLFFTQLTSCQIENIIGPTNNMKWGIPDGTQDDSTSGLLHEDFVNSGSLFTLLADLEWGRAESTIINSQDPLSDLDKTF